MNEVPLYPNTPHSGLRSESWLNVSQILARMPVGEKTDGIQEYLAHEKTQPSRTSR